MNTLSPTEEMRKWINISTDNEIFTKNEISFAEWLQLTNNQEINHCKDGHTIICKKNENDEIFAEVVTVKLGNLDIICSECIEKLKEKYKL